MADQESAAGGPRTFGIGAVARMTGLTDHTIRVWERRYQAVVAERSGNGRRVYLPADIEKLKLLKLLTDNGLSISRIAAESVEALAARVEEMRELASPLRPEKILSVAILGELLPTLLNAEPGGDYPIQLIASASQEIQLKADLEGQVPDVLVVELPVISADTGNELRRLKRTTGSSGIVCVYGFARSQDAEGLRSKGVQLLRAPVTTEEAVEAMKRAAANDARSSKVKLGSSDNVPADVDDDHGGPIEPRLFSQQQLSMLARQSSAIDCECPQHLADLVGALTAFEVYSASCASASDADEALHRYLHRTTSRARALIEKALQRVAREEGLI